MCKIGDIIAIESYIGDDNQVVDYHYFVVISDSKGKIGGFNFDIVGSVMSSFKNEKHRKKKLKYIENVEITTTDFIFDKNEQKDGFVKADQLYYFNKERIKYEVVGVVSEQLLERLYYILDILDKKNKLHMITKNLEEVK